MTTRGRGQTRECPVEARSGACGARVAPGRIMCQPHWQKVPADLRTAYFVAWGRFQETHLDEAWNALTDARAAALGSVAA